MKVELHKFVKVGEEWTYLSNLNTDTEYFVFPDKFVKMDGFCPDSQTLIARTFREELNKMGYQYDMEGMTNQFNGLTAFPLMEYDTKLDEEFPEEKEICH